MYRGVIFTILLLLTPLLVSADTCPSLTLGSSGASVTALQQILYQAYANFPTPTGYFGSLTKTALTQWQKEHGLEAVGFVGPKTAAAMKLCTPTVQGSVTMAPPQTNISTAALIQALLAQVAILQAKIAALIAANATSTSDTVSSAPHAPVPIAASSGSGGSGGGGSPVSTPVAPVVASITPPPRIVSSQTSLSILPSTLQYPSSEAMDFLLQDVCTDSRDVPIAGDPAVCPSHRDIRFGEFMPYIHTDYVSNLGGSASSWYTYPTQAPDGSALVMKIHEWGGKVQNTSYRDFDTISPSDGIDLIEANGSHVSIIATQNNVQPLSPLWNPSCTNDDTWKLFPTFISAGDVATATSSLAFGSVCPSTFATALNVWHYYTPAEPTTYTSGKRLTSLIEWHYDAADPRQAGSFEQMYFTKEYGVTRWEAWQTVDNCLNYVVPNTPGLTAAYCSAGRTPQCNGADHLSNVWGKDYIRVDCHDLTYTKDYDIPLNPLINPAGGNMVLSKNLLTSGDFAQGLSSGWQSSVPAAVSWTLKKNYDNNWYMQMQCSGQCAATSGIYQDISVATLAGKKKILFGALLRATADTGAYISVDLLDTRGNRIAGKKTLFGVSNLFTHSDDTLAWDFTAQPVRTIRFQVIPADASTSYDLDEAYVTPMIAGANEPAIQ